MGVWHGVCLGTRKELIQSFRGIWVLSTTGGLEVGDYKKLRVPLSPHPPAANLFRRQDLISLSLGGH